MKFFITELTLRRARIERLSLRRTTKQRRYRSQQTNTYCATERWTTLSQSLYFLGIIDVIGAAFAGMEVGSNNLMMGVEVFVVGCVGGLLLLACARVLDYLHECVQLLRRISGQLKSKE